jgi:hypothetical protein
MVTLSNDYSFQNPRVAAPVAGGGAGKEKAGPQPEPPAAGAAGGTVEVAAVSRPYTVEAVRGGRVSVVEWPGWSFENPVPMKAHNGRTPLHLAAAYGHSGVVEELVRSAKPTMFKRIMALKTKWEGWNCLHFACHGGHTEVVTILGTYFLGTVVECLKVHDKGGLLPVQLAKQNKEGDWGGTIGAIFELVEREEQQAVGGGVVSIHTAS